MQALRCSVVQAYRRNGVQACYRLNCAMAFRLSTTVERMEHAFWFMTAVEGIPNPVGAAPTLIATGRARDWPL